MPYVATVVVHLRSSPLVTCKAYHYLQLLPIRVFIFLNHFRHYRGHIAVYDDSYHPTSGLRIDRVNLYLWKAVTTLRGSVPIVLETIKRTVSKLGLTAEIKKSFELFFLSN